LNNDLKATKRDGKVSNMILKSERETRGVNGKIPGTIALLARSEYANAGNARPAERKESIVRNSEASSSALFVVFRTV